MRHALPDGADAALVAVARGSAAAPERRPLVAVKACDRRLPRGPVHAAIGHGHPVDETRLERCEGGEGGEGQRSKAIALHKCLARFGRACGPRPILRAGARLHLPIAAEGERAGMKQDGAGLGIPTTDQRAGVIAEKRPRHSTEMRERCRDPRRQSSCRG